MTNNEGRIVRLETLMRYVLDALRKLGLRADALEQQARATNGISYNWGGGGGASGHYVCMTPSSGTFEATGTWPSLTPGSFTADVYKSDSGALVLVAEEADVYCYYPASPANDKVVTLAACGDGSFGVLGESCV